MFFCFCVIYFSLTFIHYAYIFYITYYRHTYFQLISLNLVFSIFNLQAVTKEGYLMKQKWKFHQRWRRRYFRLKGHKLYYSKDANEVYMKI